MGDAVIITCNNTSDPKTVVFGVPGVWFFEVPQRDYEAAREALGLPELICPPE